MHSLVSEAALRLCHDREPTQPGEQYNAPVVRVGVGVVLAREGRGGGDDVPCLADVADEADNARSIVRRHSGVVIDGRGGVDHERGVVRSAHSDIGHGFVGIVVRHCRGS